MVNYSKNYEKYVPINYIKEIFFYFFFVIIKLFLVKKISNEHNFLVIGLGRSGTSAICSDLSSKLKLYNFNEIFHFPLINASFYLSVRIYFNELLYKRGSVCKLLTYQFDKFSLNLQSIAKQCEQSDIKIIFVYRESYEQILSVCYSNHTKIWHNRNFSNKYVNNKLDKVDIPIEDFKQQLIKHKHQLKLLALCEKTFAGCQKFRVSYEKFLENGIKVISFSGDISFNDQQNLSGEYLPLSEGGVISRINNNAELWEFYKQWKV